MALRFISFAAAIAVVQLSTACGPSAPETESVQEKATADEASEPCASVVAFGDSLFAGYQLGRDEGFVPALERSLSERGLNVDVHNAAVSGDTTAKGRERLAFMLDGLDRKPDLVLVELGANDMLRGLDLERTKSNLTAILEELDERDIDAMLIGMLAAPNMGADYAETFNAIYPDLAERFDVPLYPFVLDGIIGNPTLMLPDAIHPNARGADRMAGMMTGEVADNLPGCRAEAGDRSE